MIQAVLSGQLQQAGACAPFYNLVQVFRSIMQRPGKLRAGDIAVAFLQAVGNAGEQKILIAGIQAHEIAVEAGLVLQGVKQAQQQAAQQVRIAGWRKIPDNFWQNVPLPEGWSAGNHG